MYSIHSRLLTVVLFRKRKKNKTQQTHHLRGSERPPGYPTYDPCLSPVDSATAAAEATVSSSKDVAQRMRDGKDTAAGSDGWTSS